MLQIIITHLFQVSVAISQISVEPLFVNLFIINSEVIEANL